MSGFLRVTAAAFGALITVSPAMIGSAYAQATTVTGIERLRWEQPASTDPAGFRFRLYVNGEARDLVEAQCAGAVDAVHSCSAPLPALVPGTYVLELATITGGTESARSAAIQMVVPSRLTDTTRSVTEPAPAAPSIDEPVCFGDGRCFTPVVVATSDSAITSPVAAGDGRLLFIEDHRHVRVLNGTTLEPQAVISAGEGGRLVALVLAPDFASSRLAYVATVQETRSGRALSVTRVREVNNRFGQPAVILADLPLPAEGDPLMAVDAEGYLYLAMPVWTAGSDPYNGALLRYAADGTVPRDAGQITPVIAASDAAPVGIAAEPGRARVWVLRAAEGVREVWSASVASASMHVRRESRWASTESLADVEAEPFAALASERQRTPILFTGPDGALMQASLDGAAASTPQRVPFPHPVTAVAALPDGGIAIVARPTDGGFSLLKLTSAR